MPEAASHSGSKVMCCISTNTLSSQRARGTEVMPLSVAKPATAITISTTSDLRLPPPTRVRLRAPQPDAITMPMPNITPPTMDESHSTRRME